MSETKTLTDAILTFRDARDWAQYHTGKDVAMCLSVILRNTPTLN